MISYAPMDFFGAGTILSEEFYDFSDFPFLPIIGTCSVQAKNRSKMHVLTERLLSINSYWQRFAMHKHKKINLELYTVRKNAEFYKPTEFPSYYNNNNSTDNCE